MVRPPCEKLNVRKGKWTEEDDAKMVEYVSKRRTGLGRCGKSCKYKHHLRHDIKHESFTPEEEETIINLHATIGSRWSIIAQQLPGRTDNDVKNYWNTKLKKKLCEMGIDHVTHKPFSQIIADYSNIGAFSGARICSPNGNFNNTTFIQMPEQSSVQLSELKESFLSNNINNYTDNSQCLDLLSQLQAITLVTQKTSSNSHINDVMIQQQLCNEYASSSSSSSPPWIENEGLLASSFSWRDFLLEEAPPLQTEGFKQENLVPQEFSSEVKNGDIKDSELNECNNILMHSSFKGSEISGDGSSFVEAMLKGEHEHDKFLVEFPSLLEDPCYYQV